MSPSNGEEFVTEAVERQLKAELFDQLVKAIEIHQWKINGDPGEAETADEYLYDTLNEVKRKLRV
jgi:hypothetical protein